MLDSPELDDTHISAMLDLAKQRSRALGTRRRRRLITGGTVAVAAVVALFGSLVIQPGARTVPRQAAGATGSVAPTAWHLVSDVSQGSWQEHPSLSGSQRQYGLVCPTSTTCYTQEIGLPTGGDSSPATAIEVTLDGGATWTQVSLPDGTLTSTGLACVDASNCAAGATDGGNAVFVTTDDGGQTWTVQPGPSQLSSSFQFFDVACTTAASCIAIGGESPTDGSSSEAYFSLTTSDGGQDWADSAYPAGFVPEAVNCSTAGDCETAGFESPTSPNTPGTPGGALYSTDGGSTWAAASVPSDAGPLVSISCDGQGDCTGVTFGDSLGNRTGGQVLTTSDGGQSWTMSAGDGLPPSLLQGLSCSTASYCWVGGAQLPSGDGDSTKPIDLANLQGQLASTTDGGQTWQEAQLPPDLATSVVVSVSCPTTATCLALAWDAASGMVLLSYGS